MQRIGEVLDLDLPARDDDDLEPLVKMAKLHLVAADTALKVQVRVDEARLRRQNVDILPEIVKILAEEKAKLSRLKTIEALP
jgi:hypothetical protein